MKQIYVLNVCRSARFWLHLILVVWSGVAAAKSPVRDSAALRLAWYRLRYPVDLGDKPREAYRAYLADHASEAVVWLLEQKDPDGIRFLLECTQPDRQTLTDACALAREKGAAEALALLLEEQHRRFDGGTRKEFAL